MLKIKNISLNNTIAQCDFFPEDGEKFGTMKMDINTEEVIHVDSYGEKYADMYIAHARNKLIEICNSAEPIPEEAYSIWY